MDGADWLAAELGSLGCAACGQPYRQGRVRLIAEREGLYFVDLSCAHCGAQAVAIVSVEDEKAEAERGAGQGRVRLVDERGETMARRPRLDLRPVSADDVLEVHALLESFSGDVHELLARLDGAR
jgi:hypothetical protein